MLRTFAALHDGELPNTLREDFAGTAAVAAAWVACDEHHQAVAVEADPATAQWAWEQAEQQLAARADDLHILVSDVMATDADTVPPVDVTCALNFSTLIYHTWDQLVAYFTLARAGLVDDGMLVIDVYGGRGAETVGSQSRRIVPTDEDLPPFAYIWEQRSFDPKTRRVLNAISFELENGDRIADAFVYDWTLWPARKLRDAMLDAGFEHASIWLDPFDHDAEQSTGQYEPVDHVDDRHDHVAYVVGVRHDA